MIIILSLISGILFLSSCSLTDLRIQMLNKDNDGKKADIRLKEIIESINNKDKDSLKKMFSEQAL